MSATYSLVCDECKVMYWAGQGESLYSQEKTAEFLYEHQGHPLRFVNDLVDDEALGTTGYKEIEL